MVMNYNHPYAKYGKEVFVNIPIVAQISGTVAEVNIVVNKKVKKGDILFSLQNEEQTITLKSAEAALAESKNAVFQECEALVAAIAMAAKAKANEERSEITSKRYNDAHVSGGINPPFTQQQVDNKKKLLESAQASTNAAKADERRLRLVTESKILGENTQVAQLQASRDKAKLDLERTIIRAPVDGTPTQIAIRPGVRARSLPLRPVMSFIPTEKRRFAAAFWQNSLLRLEIGIDAEVILVAVPEHVFTCKVVDVLPAMSEGEMQANGNLLPSSMLMRHGFVIAAIELDENLDDYNLPLGVQGQGATLNYEHDILHVSLVRRILLRMLSWLKYVYPIK
jgi:multidrug resistance efflux pump